MTRTEFLGQGFIRRVEVMRDKVPDYTSYPFNIPALTQLRAIELHPRVTYFVGENGSGKSTLIEAIAVAIGFNAEGGSMNFGFATRKSESPFHQALRLIRNARRPKTGYFLRAESFFNVGTEIERLDREHPELTPLIDSYGGRSLHEQSHGESFLALLNRRFGPQGLYILDEPEAALSPTRQLTVLKRIHDLVEEGSQFLIATHSPIVLAYPHATIYELSASDSAIVNTPYEATATVRVSSDFLRDRSRWVDKLLE